MSGLGWLTHSLPGCLCITLAHNLNSRNNTGRAYFGLYAPHEPASRTRSCRRDLTLPLGVEALVLPAARAPVGQPGWSCSSRSFICALATEGKLQLAKGHRPLFAGLRKKAVVLPGWLCWEKSTNTLRTRTGEGGECETPRQPAVFFEGIPRVPWCVLEGSWAPDCTRKLGRGDHTLVWEALLKPLTKKAIFFKCYPEVGLE